MDRQKSRCSCGRPALPCGGAGASTSSGTGSGSGATSSAPGCRRWADRAAPRRRPRFRGRGASRRGPEHTAVNGGEAGPRARTSARRTSVQSYTGNAPVRVHVRESAIRVREPHETAYPYDEYRAVRPRALPRNQPVRVLAHIGTGADATPASGPLGRRKIPNRRDGSRTRGRPPARWRDPQNVRTTASPTSHERARARRRCHVHAGLIQTRPAVAQPRSPQLTTEI